MKTARMLSNDIRRRTLRSQNTTSDQLLQVLSAFREILAGHAKVEAGTIPVRFVGAGIYSLDCRSGSVRDHCQLRRIPRAAAGTAAQDVAGRGTRGDRAGCTAAESISVARISFGSLMAIQP